MINYKVNIRQHFYNERLGLDWIRTEQMLIFLA